MRRATGFESDFGGTSERTCKREGVRCYQCQVGALTKKPRLEEDEGRYGGRGSWNVSSMGARYGQFTRKSVHSRFSATKIENVLPTWCVDFHNYGWLVASDGGSRNSAY